MDLEKLIERVVGELEKRETDIRRGARLTIGLEGILRAAFAEVRRGALEETIAKLSRTYSDEFFQPPSIVGAGLAVAIDEVRELLPPAAEGVGPEAPTAADRAHELRSMR